MEKTEQDLLALLHYDPKWLEYGFLDVDLLRKQTEVFHTEEAPRCEHYRYAAFRRVLTSRNSLDEELLARYIELAQRDEDAGMAQAALVDLIMWKGLREAQWEELSRRPEFAAPYFQKLFQRRRLLAQLDANPLPTDLFEQCLANQDATVQRHLLSKSALTKEQFQTLSEQGATRAIRNLANDQLRRRRIP